MSMVATETELKWAVAIKQAAEADAEIDASPMSDFEFVQHAIVAKDKVPSALLRIKKLQRFKSRYGIVRDGSYEEACSDIRRFMEFFDNGFHLSLASTEKHVNVVYADYSKFDAKRLKAEEGFNIVLRGFFYLMQAAQPNFVAIREGFTFLADCQDFGWRNFSRQLEERAAQLYSHTYPVHIMHMVFLRAPAVFRFIYNLIRFVLSRKTRKTLAMTLEREIWLENSSYPPSVLPKAWGGLVDEGCAEQAMLQKLKERYDNAAKFRL